MGVAGATSDNGIIVLAGVAGLIAGAFSMGVGEYVSVQSQRELLDYQLAFQRKQLREAPAQERAILAKLYVERGFGRDEADRFVDAVFANPDHAVRLLIFEEVGLDARSIGSPLAAAVRGPPTGLPRGRRGRVHLRGRPHDRGRRRLTRSSRIRRHEHHS